MPRKRSFLTVTDQFCGAGGSSIGADLAGLKVHLALNHWQRAIETHAANFPDAHHDCADVSQVDPRRYPSTDILLTSPECTNHSVASGRKRAAQRGLFDQQPFDDSAVRSRATMFDVPRFAEYHDYRMIVVENVVDARKWVLWDAWLHAMRLLGYECEVIYLNAMFAHMQPLVAPKMGDYVPQSRDRMYVVFWKKGVPAPDLSFRPLANCPKCGDTEAAQSWKRSHGKWSRWGRYKKQYVYRCPSCAAEVEPYHYAALNAIDWSYPIERIGDRSRPLTDKTIARVKEGLRRFGNRPLVVDTAFAGKHHVNRVIPADAAVLRTQTTRQTFGLATPFLLGYANSKSPARSVGDPLRTFATENGQALALPDSSFMMGYYGNTAYSGLDAPLGAVPTVLKHSLALGPAIKELTSAELDRAVEQTGFRMLQPHEIHAGMGFPDGYEVGGTKREQVRQYGNANPPAVEKVILERCVEALA